jgi:hypothetical protein
VTSLAAVIQTAMAPAARYVALLARGGLTVTELLDRPDVEAELSSALLEARDAAEAAVLEAWDASGGTDESVIDHLMADIDKQFNALPHLRRLIRGVHSKGADAVRAAIVTFSRGVALRASLTEAMAHGAGRTSAVIAEGEARQAAGAVVYKRWRCRMSPTSCHWCRTLNNVTVPLDEDFRRHFGGPVDLGGHGVLTHPPRPWHGALMGPLLHPHCQCWLELVTEDTGDIPDSGQPPEEPGDYVSAAAIRALDEDSYRALNAFLWAAIHELGQVLARVAAHG